MIRSPNHLSIIQCALLILLSSLVHAADLEFSNPANISPPPAHAIGFPSRDPHLDVLPGFRNPPPGYGEVAFFWWLGDPLTKERLSWQLDRLANKGVMGLQINYAHTDRGGKSYGLTFPSDPPLFTENWWKLYGWFLQAAKSRGMATSLSDYTLGVGQGWVVDDAIRAHPEICGSALQHAQRDAAGNSSLEWDLPAAPLTLTAYRLTNGTIEPTSAIDLRSELQGRTLRWPAPQGTWRVIAVWPQKVEPSIDPMHPHSGHAIIEKFFQPFEDRNPGEGGRGLNFFFSDELDFRVRGFLWNSSFRDEFRRRKGYDVTPELPALFTDIGPRTPKIRLDFNDVVVSLSEENYFRPVFEWHQKRGMIYGCDHGGRGHDVTEFGDYFRTQRWNQGPGCDQPALSRDLIKNKVASSIAHLYQRPRVWIEGYHSSGWGTSSADVTDATFANFIMGQNLLTFHGLYYSTHGTWWEWAPPCNHWRMPYWDHMNTFMGCVQRLSYLLSQGTHVCDVAVIYPVAPMEAGMDGPQAVQAAFGTVRDLYNTGIDSDFIDFESMDRATIENGRLNVSGESYRVLVLPAMKAIRHSTLQKVAEFARKGGIVISVGPLPQATDRLGRNDPEVDRLVKETFGLAPQDASPNEPRTQRHPAGGSAIAVQTPAQVAEPIRSAFLQDITATSAKPPYYFVHRRAGSRDIYALYNLPKGTECFLRAQGRAELWNPWTGQYQPLPILQQTPDGTRLRLPGEPSELHLIIFSPGQPLLSQTPIASKEVILPIDGDWTCEFKPTLDNRFGDFRWPSSPGMIGPEARKFRYMDESTTATGWENPDFDDSRWPRITHSFGPMFHQLGPVPADADASSLETKLAALDHITPSASETLAGKSYRWKPYDFSWRLGVEGDPGHQGYHGLKEEMYNEFIRLGKLVDGHTTYRREKEDAGTRYYLWSTVVAPKAMKGTILLGGMKPASIWINGRPVAPRTTTVDLQPGPNPLLLRYDQPGAGYFLIIDPNSPPPASIPGDLAMQWNTAKGILPFDLRPADPKPAGWYRFKAPPGTKAILLAANGSVRCWINGQETPGKSQSSHETTIPTPYRFDLPTPIGRESLVALRIEQTRGLYAGATVPEPISFECTQGIIPSGDWSKLESLESYSGGLWYRKTLTLDPAQLNGPITLDLGRVVSSAEVLVNGQPAGVRVAPPWRYDLTTLLKPGPNKLEILIYNTLANHYQTTPTRYRGNPTSGLLGPVTLRLSAAP